MESKDYRRNNSPKNCSRCKQPKVARKSSENGCVMFSLRFVIPSSLEVGNVPIPPNKDVPPVNSVIEVRYLYAYQGGSPYQPTYIGVRDDMRVEDCVISQLKYKKDAE